MCGRDITPFDGVSEKDKYQLELDAINLFVEQLNASDFAVEMKSLWMEYESGTSKEALLCKDIDKYEMILQAYEYEKGKSLFLI
jgi:putative hydrolase of HD superfamily